MTYEDKADFLKLYKDNTIKLVGLALEAERWTQIACSIGLNVSEGSRGSGGSDKLSNAATNAVAIIQEIEQSIEAARAEREQIVKVIQGAPRRKRQLLELCYINGMTAGEIAERYGKSEKWIRQMLRDAVEGLNF